MRSLIFILPVLFMAACYSTAPAEVSPITVWLNVYDDPDGPLPSNEYTRPDPKSSTGLRLDYSRANVRNLALRALRFFDNDELRLRQRDLESLDGFSGFAPLLIPFSGPLSPASVTGANFTLVDLETAERIGVSASYEGGDGSWAVLFPNQVLLARHTFAVLIGRGLRDLENLPLTPARNWPLRGEGLKKALKVAGKKEPSFLGGYTFTVQNTTGETQAIAESLEQQAPPEPFDLVQLSASEFEGSFNAPDYRLSGMIPTSGPNATPQPVSTNVIRFYLRLPSNYLTAPRPFPLAIWGHGLTGTRKSAPQVEDAAFIGIDAVEHGFRQTVEVKDLVAFKFIDIFHTLSTRDNFRQTEIDHLTLLRMLTILDARLQAKFSIPALIDVSRLVYVGGSLGAIIGGPIVALGTNIDSTVMAVGGAGLSLAFEHGLFRLAIPNAIMAHTRIERIAFFAHVQTSFDRADSVNFLPFAVRNPLPGRKPIDFLFLEVIGDRLVPNPANETYMWAAGLELLGPVHSNMYGLPVLPGPTAAGNVTVNGVRRTAVAFQFNPPETQEELNKRNSDADPNNDAAEVVDPLDRHGYMEDNESSRLQIEHFFLSGLANGYGEVIQAK